MPVRFATDEWIKALAAELNQSPAYRMAAKDWEGDFCFVVNRNDSPNNVYLYMDLWHGECRAAYQLVEPITQTPEFTIAAPLSIWRRVIEKKLDPIQGLVTRQLKLAGPMFKVMRAPRAAAELVHCCTLIDTEWPEAVGNLSRPLEVIV